MADENQMITTEEKAPSGRKEIDLFGLVFNRTISLVKRKSNDSDAEESNENSN